MRVIAWVGVVLIGLIGAPAPLRAQTTGTGGSGGGDETACVTITPTWPAQVGLGNTIAVVGQCCVATAPAVPAVGSYRWLLAGLLLALFWRLGRWPRWRPGVVILLMSSSFAAEDRPARGAGGACALVWRAESQFELFTGTGALFSFAPTVRGPITITLTSGNAVATQTITMVPPVGDWVWRSTVPISYRVNRIWASAPDDAWAVGDNGFAIHWNGVAWQQVASNTIGHLASIWGSSANDVWAVAGGIGGASNLVHWNGQTWSPVFADTSTNLSGVWGSGPSDVWAVGGGGIEGVITHFDGVAWHATFTTSSTPLKDVWGTGPSDIWTVGSPYGPITSGESESILHYLGSTWNFVADNAPNPQAKVLTGVWTAGAGEAWTTGFGSILHWNGTAWAPANAPPFYWNQVWGRAANDVWAVGPGVYHFNGTSWAFQGLSNIRVTAVGGAIAAAGGREGVWSGAEHAIFELVPGSTLTCQTIGGTCGGPCAPAQGRLSDYPCDNGTVCCVSRNACGGDVEPAVCCAIPDYTVIPGRRPICRDGTFSCGTNAFPASRCGI